MQVIPLQPLPAQTLNVSLDGQACTIRVRQGSTGLYLTLAVGGSTVLAAVSCLNAVRIVRDAYLGFLGDLAFFDTQGSDDPCYSGLGGRWFLAYLTSGEDIASVSPVFSFTPWTAVVGVSPGVILGVGDASGTEISATS